MPTRRMIDPSFWQSESMAELSEGERLFFIGLISNADDQGRIRGHPSLLRSLIYPFDDISTEVIEARIEALSSIDSIFIYETGGKKAIQIIKWWDYQSPQWAYPSKMEPPPGWSDRLRYRANNKVHQDNWDGPGGFIDRDSYDDYANLGKDLGNALPKELGNPIEVGLESDIELESKEGDKPPPKKPATIPAYKIHVEEMESHCLTKKQIKTIQNVIGTDPPKLEQWRAVCRAWAMQANKPNNLTGLLDWFNNGIPDYARKGQNQNGQKPTHSGKRKTSQDQTGAGSQDGLPPISTLSIG